MKDDLIQKLDEFKAYSISQTPDFEEQYSSIMQPLYSAIEKYYEPNLELEKAVREYIFQVHCDISLRTLNYPLPLDLPTDYPTGYFNIMECFLDVSELLNASNEDFYNAWVLGTPEEKVIDEVPISNSIVTTWINNFNTYSQNETQNVKKVSNWCIDTAEKNGLIFLLQNEESENKLKNDEIGKIIYDDRKVLELINERQFNLYIPTYMKV